MPTVTLALARSGIAVAALFLPALAQAQGLGNLTVHSALGQPLRAEAAIVSAQPKQDGGLVGSIATPETYRAMGIGFDPVLTGVRVAVESRASGPVLLLTTSRPVLEPYLELLVVLDSAGGRTTRNYTILLEPQ